MKNAYKISFYNHTVKNEKNYLVFNLLNSTFAIMSEKEYLEYLNIDINNIRFREYIKKGIYVRSEVDEYEKMCTISDLMLQKDKINTFRIFTTYGCNAHCPYCYGRNNIKMDMTIETAKKAVSFIKETVEDNEALIITWFGGEPLVNTKVMDYICDQLKETIESKNITFSSHIMTNGLLLDEDMIKHGMEKWNLTRVKITMEGLKETYEKTKQFSIEDSYEKVLGNIKASLENGLETRIRLNYSKKNIDEILELIEFLGEKFNKYENMTVYGKSIMRKDILDNYNGHIDEDIAIIDKLNDVGLLKDELKYLVMRPIRCVANRMNYFMIDPEGNIGKCAIAMSRGIYVGSLDEGIDMNSVLTWCSPILPDKCRDCSIMPVCNGGCIEEELENRNRCGTNEIIIKHRLEIFLKNYMREKNIK